MDVEGREEGEGEDGEPGAEKAEPVINILEATGGESLTEEMQQMKSAEFGREVTPDFNEKRSGTASDQEMKANIDSMLDAQFAKGEGEEGEGDGNNLKDDEYFNPATQPTEQNEEGEGD